ncbi:MAG: ABC transporter substrate-binding protein [Clostridiales bacterium]|jgi:spermidine/putrescine transport system substrate-binding protein|nr:ABC transporter substrate-binding protein [Clostridiales bacterium]
MKKTKFLTLCKLLTLCFAVAALLPLLAACTPKDYENVLRIYNWEDYMSEEVLEDFETYYEEKYPGKDIKIEYNTFDTNETMYTKLAKGKEYYDIICPSDYMIQKLINDGLIQPLDKSKLGDYMEYVSTYIDKKFEDLTFKDGERYAIGYTWGFLGILYNVENVKAVLGDDYEYEINSWEILFNSAFKNKVFMKDSIRDTFAALAIYAYREEIMSKDKSVQDVLSDTSDELLERLVRAMNDQKRAVDPMFEVDEARLDMAASDNHSLALMWSGDAYTAIAEAKVNDIELAFALPKEGNNIFFDGFAVPKQSRSDAKTEMIYEFLNYISIPENAVKNVETIGYTSVIAGDATHTEILEYITDTTDPHRVTDEGETYVEVGGASLQRHKADVRYFFEAGKFSGLDDYDITALTVSEIMFPTEDYIEKCAVMYDFGDKTQDFNDAWLKARGQSDFPGWAIALIAVAAVLAVAGALCFIYRKKLAAFIKKKFPNFSEKLSGFLKKKNGASANGNINANTGGASYGANAHTDGAANINANGGKSADAGGKTETNTGGFAKPALDDGKPVLPPKKNDANKSENASAESEKNGVAKTVKPPQAVLDDDDDEFIPPAKK